MGIMHNKVLIKNIFINKPRWTSAGSDQTHNKDYHTHLPEFLLSAHHSFFGRKKYTYVFFKKRGILI